MTKLNAVNIGHVEWVHGKKGRGCSNCNCTGYNGEERPLTRYELTHFRKDN